jgi:hypothetical protein
MNKMNIAAKYKFTMAFENSETDDYVTEKMFQPLVIGSVPSNEVEVTVTNSFSLSWRAKREEICAYKPLCDLCTGFQITARTC